MFENSIPNSVSEQVDHVRFRAVEASDLRGFTCEAADYSLDLLMLYGFYPCGGEGHYLIEITADDDVLKMQIARVQEP